MPVAEPQAHVPRGPKAGPRDVARRAWYAVRLAYQAHRLPFVVFLAITLVVALLPTANAWLLKLVLDGIVRHEAPARLLVIGGLLGGVALLSGVLPMVSEFARATSARATRVEIQDRLFRAVNRFVGLARFEDPAFLDDTRMAQQAASTAPDTFVGSTVQAAQAFVAVCGFVVTLFVVSPFMVALIVVAAIPTLAVQLSTSRRKTAVIREMTPRGRRQMFYGTLLMDVDAAKEVRLYGLGDYFRARLLGELRAVNAAEQHVDRRTLLHRVVPQTLSALVYVGGLLWAVHAASHGRITVGDVSIFVVATVSVQTGLGQLISNVSAVYQSALTFGYYLDVVNAPPDLADPPVRVARAPRAPRKSGIECDGVWFRYHDGGAWVLRDLSLEIPAEQATAIVGLNGAGKSTLVKLLCRFYDPQRGAIRWDGVDIREIPVAELRARIGAVFQDYMRYDITVAENIGVGDVGAIADRHRIQAAASVVGIHEKLASLPHGYDTMLSRIFFSRGDSGADGVGEMLSGGQWQRLAIARALMRARRDLLILDEPSSGLDAEAERAIHDQLRQLRAGTASLLISHRLGAVRGADNIVVLDGGRVAEQGTHETLLAADGAYARLFRLQAEGYREETPGEVAAPSAIGFARKN